MAGEEPADGEHVHGGLDGAVAETVFADACGSRTMVHGAFGDPESHAFDQCGDEAVHSIERHKRVAAFRSHDFERTTGVTDAIFGEA